VRLPYPQPQNGYQLRANALYARKMERVWTVVCGVLAVIGVACMVMAVKLWW
jgi:hypothetical protein